MARGPTEKIRILLTRILMGALGVLVLFTSSKWETSIVSSSLFMVGCAFVSIGTIGRVWSSLYIAGRKTKSLVTTGPYSLCRNPLYLFSLIGAIGVGLATETLFIPALLAVGFAFYYPWVIRSEERRLRETHGEAFEAYCRTTPAFWPRFAGLHEDQTYLVNAITFRRHIVDALWFVWLVGALEIVEQLHELGWVHAQFALR